MLIVPSMPFTGEQYSFTAQLTACQVNIGDLHTGTLHIILSLIHHLFLKISYSSLIIDCFVRAITAACNCFNKTLKS
jgi:hypothetical protein